MTVSQNGNSSRLLAFLSSGLQLGHVGVSDSFFQSNGWWQHHNISTFSTDLLLVFRKFLSHGSTKEAGESIWSLGLLCPMARLIFEQGIHGSVENYLGNKIHSNSFCLRPRVVSLTISVAYEHTDTLILISCWSIYSDKNEIKFGLRKYFINATAINVIAMAIMRNTQNT